ncbi:MAG: hypothetical protein GY804_09095 [Alphaproteobacteria bacterium]|nr:hypothetical protein [Alphaproteobacteria bacterium]
MKITKEDILNLDFGFDVLEGEPTGYVTMVLDDGEHKVPIRRAVLSAYLMRPALMLGDKITGDYIYRKKKINMSGIVEIFNKIDSANFSKDRVDLHPMAIYLGQTINNIDNLIQEHMMGYQDSYRLTDIARMMQEPAIKKITDNLHLSDEEGTKLAEIKIAAAGKELEKIIKSDTKYIDFNPLFPHIDNLNMNQLIQCLIAFGPRADVNGDMDPHIVAGNAVDGMNNIEDQITEALAAKKSTWVSKDAIKTAAYSSRKVQIACFEMNKLHHGDCGTDVVIPMFVSEKLKDSFIGSFIEGGTTRGIRGTLLTKINIDQFMGKIINLYLPIGCRHKGGTCSHCLGIVGYYINPKIHIGACSTNLTLSRFLQKILSAKHLVKTMTLMYGLPGHLRNFLRTQESEVYEYTDEEIETIKHIMADVDIDNDGKVTVDATDESMMSIKMFRDKMKDDNLNDVDIYWADRFGKNINSVTILIPHTTLKGSLDDILFDPSAKNFSDVTEFVLRDKNFNTSKPLFLEKGKFELCLSSYMLRFLKDKMNSKKVTVTNKYFEVPLSGFDTSQSIMVSSSINTDIVQFVDKVNGFLASRLPLYHKVTDALTDFMNLLLQESNVSISHVSVMLKSFLATSVLDHSIPSVKDIDNVIFLKLGDAISRTASGKLAYQDYHRYFTDPETYTKNMPSGHYDVLYGDVSNVRDKMSVERRNLLSL